MLVRGKNYRAVWMEGRDVVVVNQLLLPHQFKILRLKNHRQTARAIQTMIVRGAGTIGATGAYGLAQAALKISNRSLNIFMKQIGKAYVLLREARPTAADLADALKKSEGAQPINAMQEAAVGQANQIATEYAQRGQQIAKVGLPLIKPN